MKENLFRWSTWEITESSDKWTKQDYRTIHIPVRVDANALNPGDVYRAVYVVGTTVPPLPAGILGRPRTFS